MRTEEYKIIIAETPEAYSHARELILEYTEWLGFDLSFQHFDDEIDHLDNMYSSPDGALILVRIGEIYGAVAGVRKLEDGICELKRMFVKPEFRGRGIGRLILLSAIQEAKKLNYQFMRLDTDAFMKDAIALYQAFGFIEIPAYRFNPRETARYFELDLNKAD